MKSTSEFIPLHNGPLDGGQMPRPEEAQVHQWLAIGRVLFDENDQPAGVQKGFACYEYDRNHHEAAFWSHNSWDDLSTEG
jgi:hypothetical protein